MLKTTYTACFQKASKEQKKYGKQFELTLATLIKMMAPMAPHFASELWSQFLLAPNRLQTDLNTVINWNEDVLQQSWPAVDIDYKLDIRYKVSKTCVVGNVLKGPPLVIFVLVIFF